MLKRELLNELIVLIGCSERERERDFLCNRLEKIPPKTGDMQSTCMTTRSKQSRFHIDELVWRRERISRACVFLLNQLRLTDSLMKSILIDFVSNTNMSIGYPTRQWSNSMGHQMTCSMWSSSSLSYSIVMLTLVDWLTEYFYP